MTAWISEWLRDIILIVLFAAFVDLLVPNNTLQRYVKVAVSLMILLTILSPLIKLLRTDLDIRQQTVQAFSSVTGELPPLSSVLEAGGKLRIEAEGRSARLVEKQLEDLIREQLADELEVYAEQVDVYFASSGADSDAKLERVRVVLRDEEEMPASSSGQISAEVRRIEPVQVRVTRKDYDEPASAPMDASVEASSRIQVKHRVKAHLREWLGMNKLDVLVEWKMARKNE